MELKDIYFSTMIKILKKTDNPLVLRL